jgi:hypothetical protein
MRFPARVPCAMRKVLLLCVLVVSHNAHPQEKISSRQELQTALEKAVMCDVDARTIFSNDLVADTLGVSHPRSELIKTDVAHDEDLVYHLPRGTKVFGYEAKEALSSSRSISTFFVKLRANSDQLHTVRKTLRLSPVPKGNPEGYGFFGQFEVRYIRKLPGSPDSPHDTIFSATGNQDNYVAIGCQNLSW